MIPGGKGHFDSINFRLSLKLLETSTLSVSNDS